MTPVPVLVSLASTIGDARVPRGYCDLCHVDAEGVREVDLGLGLPKEKWSRGDDDHLATLCRAFQQRRFVGVARGEIPVADRFGI